MQDQIQMKTTRLEDVREEEYYREQIVKNFHQLEPVIVKIASSWEFHWSVS